MDHIKPFEPLFGEWYAESFIGAGSFGRVYKIYREEFGEKYYAALKYISIPAAEEEVDTLHDEGMDEASISAYYTDLAKDISRETRLMNKLKGYSNIVSYEDSRAVPKENGLGYDIFIRMELLESLTSRVRRTPLKADEIAKLGVDMTTALEVCNENGIIHRDIKPENIFVNRHGDFKLGDFGIARQLEKTATFMSKKGTYNYMAPEVYKGEKYGANCDLYSLGMVMYRLLNNGRLPFIPPAPLPITPDDRERSLTLRMSGEPLPAPCEADEELGRIVLKAAAFDPDQRYATAAEMKEDLMKYLQGEHRSRPGFLMYPEHIIEDNDKTSGITKRSNDESAARYTEECTDATRGVFFDTANRTENNVNATRSVLGSRTGNTDAKSENDPLAVPDKSIPSETEVTDSSGRLSENKNFGSSANKSRKRAGIIILIAVLLLAAIGAAAYMIPRIPPKTVVFNDARFEEAFRHKYGIKGEIKEEDLLAITTLDLSNLGLKDISDIKKFKNLKTVDLHSNMIKDATPLTGMKNLTKINLMNNPLTDEKIDRLQQELKDCVIYWH